MPLGRSPNPLTTEKEKIRFSNESSFPFFCKKKFYARKVKLHLVGIFFFIYIYFSLHIHQHTGSRYTSFPFSFAYKYKTPRVLQLLK